MSIVKEEHKATLRKWREELQAKRGNRASLRRSTTVNDVCLSEGFRSLLMQTHTLWKIEAQEWRFTALALVAAVRQSHQETTFRRWRCVINLHEIPAPR